MEKDEWKNLGLSSVKGDEKKEEKPKAPKEDKPKAEKKPKAKEADDDDDEPAVPAEPKAKNPLDDLPKSSLNLEDWKRAYSNKDTRGADGAIEWFYQKCVLSPLSPLARGSRFGFSSATTRTAFPSGGSTSSTTAS